MNKLDASHAEKVPRPKARSMLYISDYSSLDHIESLLFDSEHNRNVCIWIWTWVQM